MLNSRACLRHALDIPTHRVPLRYGQTRLLQTKIHSVVRKTDARPTNLAEVEKLSRSGEEPWNRSGMAANQRKWQRTALKRPPQLARRGAERPDIVRRGSEWDDDTGRSGGDIDMPEGPRRRFQRRDMAKMGTRDSNMSDSDWNNRKRELRFLKDPLELATFVRNELSKGRAMEMLQLTRMASHSMQCIVSWNHIIDHYLANEKVNSALKVYNEMKKRAQFPDSYTYTILLRGLSINAHTSGVLSKALSIYHSMSAPNARVEPSIIHTNAALRVCARAMDMDALWGIAGKMPEKGPAAANEVTYITIINAIRQNLLLSAPQGETDDEAAARIDRGVVEGRRIWEDIVGRWRSVDLIIDEELVCAMGRLLLIGRRPRDWDDVLSLVEQTMDIARLVPRLGTPARHEAGYPRLRAPNTLERYRVDDDHLTPTKGPMRGDEFLAVTPQGVGAAVTNPLAYAQPGNNTLSLVQEACQKIVANKAAQEYWDLLCDPAMYNIQPDFNNLTMRLRNLRQNRASAAAIKLLQEDLVDKGMQPGPGTFRIAMSTCVRDKNNHNSLKHATQILHLMSKVLPDMDPKAVAMYADLALSFPLAKGQDLVDALTNLHPVVRNLRLQLSVGAERSYGNGVGAVYLTGAERQDAITCLRKIYAVYDRLVFSNLIAEEQKKPFKQESARLSAFIQRVVSKTSYSLRETLDKEKGETDSRDSLKDEGEKESNHESHDEGRGSWRKQMARPEEQRKPWFSGFGAGRSELGVQKQAYAGRFSGRPG